MLNKNEDKGLVYVGKIVAIDVIEGADFIVCATVVCGAGGKWRGIVRKQDFSVGNLCLVYLPDSLIPPNEDMKFMESSNWRVKMRRFRGAPSEVLIMPYEGPENVGFDLTSWTGVKKYHKPIPAHLNGIAKGPFPSFIPKTDEPNYQNIEGQEAIERLQGQPYYITEKADGSSTTAYKYKSQFGVCSRNWEIERNPDNGYWKIAIQYELEEKLPEGIAIQWETCGPGIQSNPMGWPHIIGLVFSGYKIDEHRYLEVRELIDLCVLIGIGMCKPIDLGNSYDIPFEKILLLGEGTYRNGKQREGVVVRSQHNFNGKPLSFKVINLNYEK